MDRLVLRAPDDFHAHLRQGPLLGICAARHAERFARAVPMPNTLPPVIDPRSLASYLDEIRRAAPGLVTVPAFKLRSGMTRTEIEALAAAGARIGKYYPAGATTNAEDGIRSPEAIEEALSVMSELGLVLSVHAEDPSAPALEREAAFLPVLSRIVREHPRLRVSVEHLSTAAGVRWVEDAPDTVAATITAHHLAFTLDDPSGCALDPAYRCKPMLKTAEDRAALRRAAARGGAKFFFGSDSAPHPPDAKAAGAAGAWTAPVALELLAEVFEGIGELDKLEAFLSERGAAFHGLPRNPGTVLLERAPWTVPPAIDGMRPVAWGQTLAWRFVGRGGPEPVTASCPRSGA